MALEAAKDVGRGTHHFRDLAAGQLYAIPGGGTGAAFLACVLLAIGAAEQVSHDDKRIPFEPEHLPDGEPQAEVGPQCPQRRGLPIRLGARPGMLADGAEQDGVGLLAGSERGVRQDAARGCIGRRSSLPRAGDVDLLAVTQGGEQCKGPGENLAADAVARDHGEPDHGSSS